MLTFVTLQMSRDCMTKLKGAVHKHSSLVAKVMSHEDMGK